MSCFSSHLQQIRLKSSNHVKEELQSIFSRQSVRLKNHCHLKWWLNPSHKSLYYFFPPSFLDDPFRVMGRVLDRIPDTDGWRVDPWMSRQLIKGPHVSIWGFATLLNGTSVVLPSFAHTGVWTDTLHFSAKSPADWTTTHFQNVLCLFRELR